MFKKKISSNSVEVIKTGNRFPVGAKFSRDNLLWTVKEAFIEDNTEMRRVIASDGTEEILTLVTLMKDAKDAIFIEEEKEDGD